MNDKQMGRPVTMPGGGNLVARFRAKRGVSQKEAGALLGISHNRLSELERADRLPASVAILASLYMAIDDLLPPGQAKNMLEMAALIRAEHDAK